MLQRFSERVLNVDDISEGSFHPSAPFPDLCSSRLFCHDHLTQPGRKRLPCASPLYEGNDRQHQGFARQSPSGQFQPVIDLGLHLCRPRKARTIRHVH